MRTDRNGDPIPSRWNGWNHYHFAILIVVVAAVALLCLPWLNPGGRYTAILGEIALSLHRLMFYAAFVFGGLRLLGGLGYDLVEELKPVPIGQAILAAGIFVGAGFVLSH